MKERLIELRKNILKVSQKEFAEKLGMAQSTYAPLEIGREIRNAYVKLICQAYNVNEQWLRTGEGEMFIEKPDHELEELLSIYDNLTPSLKKFLLRHAKELQDLKNENEL